MLQGFKKVLLGMAVGSLLALGAKAANAQVTVTLPDTTPIQSPGYTTGYDQWTFELQTDSVTHLTSGNSFTVSGITGLFNALSPANWSVTDSPALGKVTWTYTGATTSTSYTLDDFNINTTPGHTGTATGAFSASATAAAGGTVNNSGALTVPAATGSSPGPTGVPLPPAAYTFPLAMAIAALAYRRMRRLA